jgi:hypothetical protein
MPLENAAFVARQSSGEMTGGKAHQSGTTQYDTIGSLSGEYTHVTGGNGDSGADGVGGR